MIPERFEVLALVAGFVVLYHAVIIGAVLASGGDKFEALCVAAFGEVPEGYYDE